MHGYVAVSRATDGKKTYGLMTYNIMLTKTCMSQSGTKHIAGEKMLRFLFPGTVDFKLMGECTRVQWHNIS